MKAISECFWKVNIISGSRFWWDAYTTDDCNVNMGNLEEEDSHETREEAIKSWEEFALRNNITKYTFGD